MKSRYRFVFNLAWACGLFVLPACADVNPFSLTINYTGDPGYLPYFKAAEAYWERILPSYIDGHVTGYLPFNGITINASIEPIDGPGLILGSAGPTDAGIDNSNYALSTFGTMTFDSADVGVLGSNLQTIILHEMAHVIGFGTLWNGLRDINNNLIGGKVLYDGSLNYNGAAGLAAYKTEFGQGSATSVPLETWGGGGLPTSIGTK